MSKRIYSVTFFVYSLLLIFHTSTAQVLYSTGDTIKLDINQSYFDGIDVEVPVIIQSSSTVFAMDLAIRFNTNRITFQTVTGVSNGLQYLYYLNPNDSIWRFTSYNPSGIQSGSIVFNLRFTTLSNEVCAYDFSDEEAFVNGDSSVFETIGCMDNLGVPNQEDQNLTRLYPNPFTDQLHIESNIRGEVNIFDSRGILVQDRFNNESINTLSWPVGIYYVRIFDKRRNYSFKVVKVSP